MTFTEPREPGRRYRAECVVTRDGPGTREAKVELAILAEDDRTSAVQWRRVVHAISGWYDRSNCIAVDGLWLATPEAAAPPPRMLIARTAAGWFVLDARSGKPMREALWGRLADLSVVTGSLTVTRVERMGVASEPGYAFQLRIRNDGPPFLAEPSYRFLDLEAATGAGPWRHLAEERWSDESLVLVGHGAELEITLDATTGRAAGSAAGDAVRLVVVVYPLAPTGLPTSPVRAVVPIRAAHVARLR